MSAGEGVHSDPSDTNVHNTWNIQEVWGFELEMSYRLVWVPGTNLLVIKPRRLAGGNI